MLAPRQDPSADLVLPLASFDGAALSFMGTSQNVPDTLVFHFEAGADSATLDLTVVLLRQAQLVVRNLDIPVVLQRQVLRSRQVSQSCFFSIEDVSFGPFNFDDISAVWTVLLANSAHHLSRFPCLFRVLITPSLTLAGPDVLHMLVPSALRVSLSLSSWDVFELHIRRRVCYCRVEFEQPVSF